MKNWKVLTALVLVALLLFAGCSSGAKDTGTSGSTGGTGDTGSSGGDTSGQTITLMGPTNWLNDPFMKVISDWETKTGNKMEIQTLPNETFGDVMATKIATNQLADICFLYPTINYLPTTNPEANWLDLTDEAFIADIADGIFSDTAFMHNSRVIGYPQAGLMTFGAFYNKNLLAEHGIEVPTTYDDFLAACETLQAAGIPPIFEQGSDAWGTQCLPSSFWAYATREDPKLLSNLNDNSATMAGSPGLLRGMELYQDLTKYMQDNVLSGTFEQQQEALAEGTAGFVFCVAALFSNFQSNYPDSVNDIGYFIMPHPDYDYLMPNGNISQGMFVNKNGNVEGALDFFRFFASPEVLSEYYSGIGEIAPNKTLKYDLASIYEPYVEMIQKMGIEPSLTNSIDPGVGDEFMKGQQELLAGTMDAKGVLEKLDTLRKALGKDMGKEGW